MCTVSVDESVGLVVLRVQEDHLLGHEAVADGRHHIELDLDVEVLAIRRVVERESRLDLCVRVVLN